MSVAPASPHVLIPDAVLALPAGAAQPPWPATLKRKHARLRGKPSVLRGSPPRRGSLPPRAL